MAVKLTDKQRIKELEKRVRSLENRLGDYAEALEAVGRILWNK